MGINDNANTIMGQAKIYGISRGWKILFSIFIPPLILLMGAFIFMPFLQKRTHELGYVVFCMLFGSGFMLFFIYCFIAIWKSRIEIYPDKIKDVGPFKSTELFIKDIDGFKVVQTQYVQTLRIIPKDPKAKKIDTALVIENRKDFLDWINKNLNNLDVIKAKEEINLILHDAQYGETEAERKLNLVNAQKWSKILNILSAAVTFWVLFYPIPYKYAIWAVIIMPFICLGLVYLYKGLIKLDGQRNSAYPDASAALILPSTVLALRAVSDWHILNWNNFWSPFVGIFLLLIFMVFVLAKDIRGKIYTVILIAIFCSVYAYGAVITLNGILDRSVPDVYMSHVMKKRISYGKYTDYYLELSPWGPKNYTEEVKVGRFLYNKCKVGITVNVFLMKGRIGINWFYILDHNSSGIYYKNQGNLTQAISEYTKAIEIEPNKSAVYWNRALAYDAQGNLAKAISDYTKEIKISPKDAMAYNNRGVAYLAQGNLTQAISDFNNCIRIDPKHAHAYNNRGNAYDKQGNYAQAIADYKMANNLDSKYVDAHNNLGIFYDERASEYYKQGNILMAISEFTKAIEINPKDVPAYINRGIAYNKQKNFSSAIADFTKALEINPKRAEAYLGRGSIYDVQGNYNQAMSDYNKAIEINPNYAEPYYNRGRLYNLENNSAQAIVEYTKCIELNPNIAGAYYQRGMIYFNKQNYSKTWIDVQKAQELGYAVDPGFLGYLKGVLGKH